MTTEIFPPKNTILLEIIKGLLREVGGPTLRELDEETNNNTLTPYEDLNDKIGDYVARELRYRYKKIGRGLNE